MKKYLILTLAVLLTIGLAGTALATIVSSVHDLRAPDIPGETEICVVCHTPHAALSTPLIWNHSDTSNTVFTMYSSGTLDGAIAGEPNGISRLCLSCHDGSTAIDSYGGATGSVMIDTFGANRKIGAGGDLSKTHPISIVYDDQTDLELRLAVGTTMGNSGDIIDVLEDVDGDGTNETLQCSSCHDVHNGVEVPVGAQYLLRKDNTGSALCLVCHDK